MCGAAIVLLAAQVAAQPLSPSTSPSPPGPSASLQAARKALETRRDACDRQRALGVSIAAESEIECEVESPSTMQAFLIQPDRSLAAAPSTDFPVGARIALCLSFRRDLHFAIWDAPPNGKLERIYPNVRSHGDAVTSAFLQAGTRQCLGEPGSGYQIVIDDAEGTGAGQLYLVAAVAAKDLPDPAALSAFGWGSMGVSVAPEAGGNRLRPVRKPAEDLRGVADAVLLYTVR